MESLPETGAAGPRAGRRPPYAPTAAWAGGWCCILALAAWSAQLSTVWLAAAALGAALWTAGVARRGRRWSLGTTLLLWVAVGMAAGVESRLREVAGQWAGLQRRVEERAAEALNRELDALVGQGEAAVKGVEVSYPRGRPLRPTPAAFDQLEALRRATAMSAVAVFDARGAPVAWAGEHRGPVPLDVRLGQQAYRFQKGPLFSYVYFARRLQNGQTAVAAVLLESSLPVDPRAVPFAGWFARRHGVAPVFSPPDRVRGQTVWDWSADRPILSVSFAALTQENWWQRVVGRGRRAVGVVWLGALALLSMVWYRTRSGAPGLPVALATLALLVVPMGEVVGAEYLFSPLRFVLPLPWDVTLGTLVLVLVGAAVWVLTRFGGSAPGRLQLPGWAPAAAALVYVPLALEVVRRSASRGLLASQPAGGFTLQLGVSLLLAIPLFLLLRAVRERPAPVAPRALLWTAAVLTVGLAIATILLWDPARALPWWSAAAWALPVLPLAYVRPRTHALATWLLAGSLAAVIALSTLWVGHEGAKLREAEGDLARLGTEADPFLDFLLRAFADWTVHHAAAGEDGVDLLYHSWVASGLAREGYEARLTIWRGGQAEAELRLSDQPELPELVPVEVARAEGLSEPVVEHYTRTPGLNYLLLAPLPDGRIVSAAVPPRRRLEGATALARFLRPDTAVAVGTTVESLYLVPSSDPEADSLAAAADGAPHPVHWLRTETGWRSEARAHFPDGWVHAHLFVRTSGLSLLLVRALLVMAALLAVLLVLWTAARLICGDAAGLVHPYRERLRSFRLRITLALFAFFLLPTAVFGAVSYGAVSREVFRSASGVAQRALEQSVREFEEVPQLTRVGERIGADLLLYRDGTLVRAAAQELVDLGLFDAWLPPDVYLTLASGEDLEQVAARRLGENEYLVGYRRLDPNRVLAAPIPLASDEIARRQSEFRDIALLMSLLGAALSVYLSLLVGRTLARPIDELSRAAALVGSGNLRLRLPEERTDEFGGVYRAFNRMVRRLRRARTALIRETRRTETIVTEAATGVLALDSQGRVELVNPRAAAILGGPIAPGEPLPRATPLLEAVADAFTGFWRSGGTESARELEVDGRIFRLRLRRFSPSGETRGAVLALEDVTDEIRTARVLAWGEMARQVAHEIKNPLTPIKLAVQHLRRAFLDRRPDYGEILDRNVDSILTEIDRLGEIARAFSRFGTPQPAQEGLEEVDVVRAVEETLALYRGAGAGAGIRYRTSLADATGVRAVARVGELKEVLVNLLENAREALGEGGEIDISVRPVADQRRVEIVVSDTGEGIPAEQLPRIFEPHFSTRTSGTGLGLAIVRRMVESWGGEIAAESEPGAGTRMHLRLAMADGEPR